jgi:hypothetical protein
MKKLLFVALIPATVIVIAISTNHDRFALGYLAGLVLADMYWRDK